MATALPSLEELGGCIFTKPTKNHQGYATTMYKGKQMKRHRIAYIEAYGEIPKGMVVDHICHSVAIANGMCLGTKSVCIHRSCINPAHLQLVTTGENQRMGLNGFGARTHCKKGHELTEDNIYYTKIGPNCHACKKLNDARNMRKYRAEAKAEVI